MGGKYSYEEFKKIIISGVAEQCGAGLYVKIMQVLKNNSVKFDSLAVVKEGSITTTALYYLQEYYSGYLSGEGIDDIVAGIVRTLDSTKPQDVADVLGDVGVCQEHVVCRLVSYKKNQQFLKEVPYKRFLDLAVVFYCTFKQGTDGYYSFHLTNEFFRKWGMSGEELYSVAVKNSGKLFPVSCKSLESVVRSICNTADFPELPAGLPGMPFVLTNKDGMYGAAVMLYPDCLRNVCATLGNVYVLPSSIHEVLLIPESIAGDAGGLKKMVQDVNRSCVDATEILSDCVYSYCVDTNGIEICQ